MPIFYDEISVHSSFIRHLGIVLTDPRQIHVTMVGRRTYVYLVPDVAYWFNFKKAPSKGRYYNGVIKRRFDYVWKY